MWGAYSSLYVLSDRLPATRFVGFLRGCPRRGRASLQYCWDTGPEVWPLLKSDLVETPARLIIDTAAADWGSFGDHPIQSIPVLNDLLTKCYDFDRTVEGVGIYKLRSESCLGFSRRI